MIIDLELRHGRIILRELNLVLHSYVDVPLIFEQAQHQYDVLVVTGRRALNILLQPRGAQTTLEWLGQPVETGRRWRKLKPRNRLVTKNWSCRIRYIDDGHPH